MKNGFLLGAAGATAVFTAGASASMLDQVSPDGPGGQFNGTNGVVLWQQEVVVGVTGYLDKIELFAVSSGAYTTPVAINLGAGPQFDADDFSTVLAGSGSGVVTIDLINEGIFLNAGETFVIRTGGGTGSLNWAGAETPGLYAAGGLFLVFDGAPGAFNGDFQFNTYMKDIPAPGAALLAVTAAIVGCSRRRRAA